LGNSNSIASVDLTGAYTGLRNYYTTIVGTLTFIVVYGGPFYFHGFAALRMIPSLIIESQTVEIRTNSKIQEKTEQKFHLLQYNILLYAILNFLFRGLSMFVFSIQLTAQRYHLFVWSVFAPRYIYECTHMADLLITYWIILTPFGLWILYYLYQRK